MAHHYLIFPPGGYGNTRETLNRLKVLKLDTHNALNKQTNKKDKPKQERFSSAMELVPDIP